VRAETRAELDPDVQDDEGPVELQGEVRSITLPRESVQARATLWDLEVTADWRTDELLSVRRVTRLRDASEVPLEFGTCTSPCALRADFPDPGELAGEILVVELDGVFAEPSRHPEQAPLALTVPRDFPRAERVMCAAQFDTSEAVVDPEGGATECVGTRNIGTGECGYGVYGHFTRALGATALVLKLAEAEELDPSSPSFAQAFDARISWATGQPSARKDGEGRWEIRYPIAPESEHLVFDTRLGELSAFYCTNFEGAGSGGPATISAVYLE
jgi:hypothetical protein